MFTKEEARAILAKAQAADKAMNEAAARLKDLMAEIQKTHKQLWKAAGHSGAHAIYQITSQLAPDIRRALKKAGFNAITDQEVILEVLPPADLTTSLRGRGLQ